MQGPHKNIFWDWITRLTLHYPYAVLAVVFGLTLIFSAFLTQIKIGTDIRDFHRTDALNLIDTIEKDFEAGGGYLSLIFETQTEESLLAPVMLKEQFKILQAIQQQYKVVIHSPVTGLNEGLKNTQNRTLYDVDNYDEIAGALLAMAGPRTVVDLEKVSRHFFSNPEIVTLYERLRLVLGLHSAGGGSRYEFAIPYLKALFSYVELSPDYTDKEQQKALVGIRDLVTSLTTADLKVYAIAGKLISHDIDERSGKNVGTMALILVLGDILLLWGVFKSRNEMLLALFTTTNSVIWTFGLATILGINLSFLHLIVLPILLGVSIDDNIVFGGRFAEEWWKERGEARVKRGDGAAFEKALGRTYHGTGTGIFLATFTTFVGFFSASIVSSARAVSSFFLMVGYAMVIDFILSLLLQGALRTIFFKQDILIVSPQQFPHLSSKLKQLSSLKRWWAGLSSQTLQHLTRIMQFFPQLAATVIAKKPGAVLLVAAVLFLVSAGSAWRVGAEFDQVLFMTKDMPSYTAYSLEKRYFGGRVTGYVLFEGEVANPLLLQKIKLLEERMAHIPKMQKLFDVANVDSGIELINKMNITITPSTDVPEVFDRIATSTETANWILDESYAERAKHLLRKKDGRYDGLLLKFVVDGSAPADTKEVIHAIKGAVQNLGFNEMPNVLVRVGGGETSFHMEAEYYTRNMVQSFFVSLAVNFLILFIFWKRFFLALLAMVPLVFAVTLTLGMMGLAGLQLNMLNLCIGSIVVGLGVDYSIHLIERLGNEKKVHPSYTTMETMLIVLRTMGPSIFAAVMTSIVGFSSACILGMPIAVTFAILTSLTLFLVYLASILVLPIILVKYGKVFPAPN